MRAGLVIVGVVLIAVGATLGFVPFIPQASQTVTDGRTAFTENLTGYSPTGSIAGSLSWSSNQSIEVVFSSCPASCVSGSIHSQTESGLGGTFSFSFPVGTRIGALIATGPPDSTATVKVTLAEPTYGTLLIIAGFVVVVAGVLLGRKPSPVPAEGAPPSGAEENSRGSAQSSPAASGAEAASTGAK